MAARLNGEAIRWLEALGREGSLGRLDDGELLDAFLARDAASSDAAFEVLVRRHGPMVLGLCRGLLRDDHAVDDAFQATFLVLARRAATIRDRDDVAPWLARVAGRIARRARAEAARRALRERRASADQPAMASAAGKVDHEAAAMIRAEVDRLPEADRLLLRLTYWQGRTYAEVAALLSWPIGTVRSRLSRARDRLRDRLSRLGLAPPMVLLGRSAPPTGGAAAPSDALVLRTVRAAGRVAGGMTAAVEAGVVPAGAAALANGELTMMATIPWKPIAALLLLGGTLTAGVVARVGSRREPVATPAAPLAPIAAAAPQAKPEARPLIVNGGVEKGDGDVPSSWSEGAAVPGVEYRWSRDAHTGNGSLCLKKTAQRYFPIAQWSQKVEHKGNAPRLKVSAWVKADRCTKAILDAQFLDGGGKWSHAWVAYIGAKEANDPPATHGWKRYRGVVEIPRGTRQIVLAPQIYGPGIVGSTTWRPSTPPIRRPTRPRPDPRDGAQTLAAPPFGSRGGPTGCRGRRDRGLESRGNLQPQLPNGDRVPRSARSTRTVSPIDDWFPDPRRRARASRSRIPRADSKRTTR
jgi:RNA polymerase sigma-70 factor (ECF subfamily)